MKASFKRYCELLYAKHDLLFIYFCIYLPTYIITDYLRDPHSLLYNGYRVSFQGASGRSVALTTQPL